MNVYLSHIDCFSDVDPNAISLKYSMYMLANTENNGNPIASPSCLYMSDSILKKFVFQTESQHLHHVIYGDTGVFFQ